MQPNGELKIFSGNWVVKDHQEGQKKIDRQTTRRRVNQLSNKKEQERLSGVDKAGESERKKKRGRICVYILSFLIFNK